MADFESDRDLLLFLTSEAVQAALQDMPAYEHQPFWLAQGADPYAVVEDNVREDFSGAARPPIPKAFPPVNEIPLAAHNFTQPPRYPQQRDRVPCNHTAFSPASSFTSYLSSQEGSAGDAKYHISDGSQQLPLPPQLSMSADHSAMTPSTIHLAMDDNYRHYGVQPPQSSASLQPQAVVNNAPNGATYSQASELASAFSVHSLPLSEFDSQLDNFPNHGRSCNYVHVAASSPYSTSYSSPPSDGGDNRRPPTQNHISMQQPLAPQYVDNPSTNPFDTFQSANGSFEQCARLPNQSQSQAMFNGSYGDPNTGASTVTQGPQVQHVEYPSEDPNRRRVAKLPARQPRHKNGQSAYGIGMNPFEGHNVPIRHPLSSADVASGHLAHLPVDNRTSGHGHHIVSTHQVAAQGPVHAPSPPVTTHAACTPYKHCSASLSREAEQPFTSKSVRAPETGGLSSSGGDLIERKHSDKVNTRKRAQQENGQATGRAFAAQPGPQSFSNAKSSRQFKARDPFRACKRPWEQTTDGQPASKSQPNKKVRIDGSSSSAAPSQTTREIPSATTSSSSSSRSNRPASIQAPQGNTIRQERYCKGMIMGVDERALASQWLDRPFIFESGIKEKSPAQAESVEVEEEERLEG